MYPIRADRIYASLRKEYIWLGFFRRVLTTLSTQLAVTFGLATIFVRMPSFYAYAHRNPRTFGFSLSAMSAMMLAFILCGNLRKKSPDKYIVLLVIAVCEAYMLGELSYCKEELDIAIVLTMMVAMVLAVIAFWIKYDSTMLAVFTVVRMAVPQLFVITVAIWSNAIVSMKYVSLWVVLCSLCLLIDVQRIRGWRQTSALPQDELFVAFHLHLDFIHVCMYILAILEGSMMIG